MAKEKKIRSFRRTLFLTIGLLLTGFAVVFFVVFQASISGILLDSETDYLLDQAGIIAGVWESAGHNTLLMAEDTAYWDESVRFVRGENPDFIKRNWSATSLVESYDYDFVFFKDLAGVDVYADFYDVAQGEHTPVPDGLSAHIAALAATVSQSAERAGTEASDSRTLFGIFLQDSVPYFAAIAPIHVEEAGEAPSGTVAMGSVLSNAYFHRLLRTDALDFEITPAGEASGDAGSPFTLARTGDTISASMTFACLDGGELALTIRADRAAYRDGRQAMGLALFMLALVTALFVALLYFSATKWVLRPLERLSEDIRRVMTTGGIDSHKYSNTREYVALCNSINDMLLRLNQSRISVDVFRRVLNSMNAMIYVSDVETDELLFVNDTLQKSFGLEEFSLGKPCWTQMQAGQTARCPFCPVPALLDQSDFAITWEEKSSVTGRYYLNTDCLIHWYDDKLAHLHHRVDITDNKAAESSLEQRLRQQEIMSDIAQRFIKTPDIPSFIRYALRVSGEFLDAGRAHITSVNPETGLVELQYEWHNQTQGIPAIGANFRPFGGGHPIYDALVRNNAPYVAVDDIARHPNLSAMTKDGVQSFMALPIVVSGALWGILNVAMIREKRAWTESDAHLFSLIANVIAAGVERVQSEEKLVRMSSIVNTSPNYITYITADGKFEYLNPGAERITGYSREELMKGGFGVIVDETTREALFAEHIPRTMRQGKDEFEMPIIRKNGERRTLSVSTFVIEDRSWGLGAIGLDITERRKLERDLIVAKEQAEQSSQAKGDFLSRMSHEMRTPMNAIIGMTHMAKTSDDADKKEYCLDKIGEASTHLLGVINDVLDMSKIEANKFTLSPTAFPFERMLQKAVGIIGFRVEEKGQRFRMEVDPAIPGMIVADEQRLAQVITNLLSNAVKFTPEHGSISLRAQKVREANGVCTLQVEVADTGIGISEEQQRKLFRSFEQADGGVSRKFGGTGLGLAISKSIVGMMNGRIWVESEEGRGARFLFTADVGRGGDGSVPMENEAAAPEENAARGAYAGLRVLLAEDVDINREIAESLLAETGIIVDPAENGRVAYEKFRANPGAYSLILMDVHMPEMDGYEATRRIRALNVPEASAVPIVAMTANVFREDIEKCLAAGMNDHIGKPLDVEEFFAKLRKNLGR